MSSITIKLSQDEIFKALAECGRTLHGKLCDTADVEILIHNGWGGSIENVEALVTLHRVEKAA